MHVFAEKPEPLEKLPAPEGRRLRPANRTRDPPVPGRGRQRRPPHFSYAVVRVDEAGSSDDPLAISAVEDLHYPLERPREVVVVRVDEGNDVARGAAEAFVEGVCLAFVQLGGPPCE